MARVPNYNGYRPDDGGNLVFNPDSDVAEDEPFLTYPDGYPSDTEYGWQWYEGLLGNANYYSHGANQPGDVVIVNDRDVSTAGLPQRWGFVDEWYNLIPFPTEVNFLAVVDESTLPEGPGRPGQHPGHGDFHPVSWCQYYDGGRSWVTTLGHGSDAFRDPAPGFPGPAYFQAHIVGGIKSAMGLEPFCTPARGN